MARRDDYSMDDFNIEDYTRQVDFGSGPDRSGGADPQGDTGRYDPRVVARKSAAQPPNQRKSPRKKKKAPLGLRILKKLLIILIYLLVVTLAAYFLASAGWSWANDLLALNKEEITAEVVLEDEIFTTEESVDEEGEPVTVTVADMDAVASELHENGLIEYEWLFKLFARFTHKDEALEPGTYELNTTMDYSALLRNMGPRSVARTTVDIMVPEGYTLEEILKLLADNDVAELDELEDAAANYDFDYEFLDSSTLGDASRLEGYLFPDTYQFYQNTDAAAALAKLLDNFDTRFTSEMRAKAQDMGYSLSEILTVASIVEKETDGVDQANIASVIYNRLTRTEGGTNGYLQMDSTIQYILDERKETLTQADLAIDSPYNTYLYTGLPVGPICNPGLEAINAALEPAESDYFFFVLGDDGATHFFNSYDEFTAFRDAQTGEIQADPTGEELEDGDEEG